MNSARRISSAIVAYPQQFDLGALVTAATELLGEGATISADDVHKLIAEQLVDAPGAEPAPFGRRHLLQLIAIRSLQRLDLEMSRIQELVQGVDDSYLQMLCDEPVEAEKKAAVMSNWLKMLSNGRVGRPNRGDTHILNAPEAHSPPHHEPLPTAGPVRVTRGNAPVLDIAGADIPPPPAAAARDGERRAPPHSHDPGHLPELPGELPAARQRAPRVPRATMAASAQLARALREQMHGASVTASSHLAPPDQPAGPTPESVAQTVSVAEALAESAATLTAAPKPWARWALASGVELHVQHDHPTLSPEELERIVAEVRRLLAG
ncbi:MAG: hypothetical protein KC502_16050 [Myxococcales bacterium]|nr:hypothetical protein [Myxococcales bacterium]